MKLIVGSVFSLHTGEHSPALKLLVLAQTRQAMATCANSSPWDDGVPPRAIII